jgi:hypothetical protein
MCLVQMNAQFTANHRFALSPTPLPRERGEGVRAKTAIFSLKSSSNTLIMYMKEGTWCSSNKKNSNEQIQLRK